MKVLYIPHSAQKTELETVVQHGIKELNWRVSRIVTDFSQNKSTDYHDVYFPYFHTMKCLEKNIENKYKELITKSELAVGEPINRVLIAAERDLGRVYSRTFYIWPETKLAQLILKKTEIVNHIILNSFKFIYDLMIELECDFVMGGHKAGIIPIITDYICALLDVPHVIRRQSKIHDKRHYWTDDIYMFNRLTEKKYTEMIINKSQPSTYAHNYLREFRNNPEPVEYIKNNQKGYKRGLSLLETISKVNSLLLLGIREKIYAKLNKKDEKIKLLSKIYYYPKAYFYRKKNQSKYRQYNRNELKNMLYIYISLHKQPELTSNVQSRYWYDQLNTIKILSYSLPFGYNLLVKEHKVNYCMRDSYWYRVISSLPNVILIDAFDCQYKYIQNANIIVTDNGTVGWEALLLSKKLILLNESFYNLNDCLYETCKITDIAKNILLLLNSQSKLAVPSDYDLLSFIDADREATLKDGCEPSLDIWHINNFIKKLDVVQNPQQLLLNVN